MLRAYARYGQADPEAELLRKHAGLLDRCARRLAARSGHVVQADDLWSAGAMGLLEAARRFDPGQGARFETFAEHRIRGAMLDEMRRMDHLPRRLRADTDKVEVGRAKLSQALGRDPTADELAEALGAPVEDVAELLQLLQPAMPIEEETASSGHAPADELLDRAHRSTRLADAIAKLPERLQILLALYYEEELTYREIAKILGVSEPRVCQLHSDAAKRLRELLAE
jgi:RNA polymerase sigma factor for flagellar operon FliA